MSRTLEVDLVTIPNVAASTVVALPPSTLDPATDEMRVYVNGVLTIREFDPVMP